MAYRLFLLERNGEGTVRSIREDPMDDQRVLLKVR